MMKRARPTKLPQRRVGVTKHGDAPFRGEGWDTLNALVDVVYDPWIEHVPLKLDERREAGGAPDRGGRRHPIVESDSVKGPVFDLPLLMIGSCRGDPNNVDVEAATKAGIPVLRAPGRNADAVAEITIALLFAGEPVQSCPPTTTCGPDQVYAGGKIPYQRYRAWQLAGPHRRRDRPRRGLGARPSGGSRGSGCEVLSFRSVQPRRDAPHTGPSSRRCSPSAMSYRCTRWSHRNPNGSWAPRNSRR